jgi:hypothetical protein
MGLLGGGIRTATCTALDHVDVVKIAGEDFTLMLSKFPPSAPDSSRWRASVPDMNRRRVASTEHVPITDFLNQGLMEAQSLLVLDSRNARAAISACRPAPTRTTE